MARHLCQVARADVEARPRWQLLAVGQVRILRRGVDAAGVQAQAWRAGHVPFAAHAHLGFRRANGALAIVGGHVGLALLRLEPRQATQQAHALHRRAENRQFQASVALLASHFGALADHGQQGLGRGEQGGAHAQLATVILDADFLLLRFVRRKHLTHVLDIEALAVFHIRPRGRRSLDQRLDVVGVQRHVLAGFEDDACHGCRGALVIGLALQHRVVVVVTGILDLLAAQAHGQQQLVVEEGHGVGQGIAAEDGFLGDARVAQAAARIGCCRRGDIDGRVNIGGKRVADGIRIFRFIPVPGPAGHQRVLDGARDELAANAHFARADFLLARIVEARHRGVAIDRGQ